MNLMNKVSGNEHTSTLPSRAGATIRLLVDLLVDLGSAFRFHWKSRSAARDRKKQNLVIGFDGYPFLEPLTGVGWYAYHLLEDFACRDDVVVNLYTHTLIPEKTAPGLFIPFEQMKNLRFRARYIPSGVFPNTQFWFFLGACVLTPLFIALDRNDIFFAPNFVAPRWFRVVGKKVITIHDCTFAFFPELVRAETLKHLQKQLPKAIREASRIIAVSNQTKKDIEKLHPSAKDRVEVIYNGNAARKPVPTEIPGRPYLLFVGTLEPRKNILSILEAFQIVRDNNIHFHLYLIGKIGWRSEAILEKLQSHPFAAEIHQLSYVPSGEIASFYRDAFCFLFPSLYEGFGLPVVEAMSLRCPVIATALAAIPEVGGDACLYVKPNPKAIAEGIIKLYKDPDLRRSLIEKGVRQAGKFTWNTCADRTLNVLLNATGKQKALMTRDGHTMP